MEILNKDNIHYRSIEEEMRSSYLDYAMSVIVSRALPDCRDGLKPVHRRILYSMYESGIFSDKPYRKSARVVGEVMGKYHPHGDSAIYSALVRMAQSFSLRVPLVDGQGNFGSIDGDSPAHMRYTEARLSRLSQFLLDDISKDAVSFSENYDGSEIEPEVLPAKFPNLLVNGAGGIAVGMATSIPTYNLGEVLDACCAMVDNHDINDDDLLNIIPAPDFPTGAEIINGEEVKKSVIKGRGKAVMRALTTIENHGNRESIIIKEIPYQVNKSELLKNIELLSRNKVIEGISEIRDESSKLGIRVVIDLKKDVISQVILEQLYKNTQMQSNFSINMVALKRGMPCLMGVKEIIYSFLDFRKEVIRRRTTFLLNKARAKAHILLGLCVAVAHIDEIIKLIKSSSDSNAAKKALLERKWDASGVDQFLDLIGDADNKVTSDGCFYFTQNQAKAILDMRLHKLTGLESGKLNEELLELSNIIKNYLELLSSKDKLANLMKEEFLEIKSKILTPRKTVIKNQAIDVPYEALIEKEDMAITLTKDGFIKRVQLEVYKSQRRGGKGRSAMNVYENDIITDFAIANTHESLLFFSLFGRVYRLKTYKIPVATPQSRGRALVNLLPLEENDSISNIANAPFGGSSDLNIVFATKKGNARRNKFSDFKNIQSNGKIAIRLDDGDNLLSVSFCKDDDHLLFATKEGKAVRFSISALRVFKSRASDGVKAVKLSGDNDCIVSLSILNSGELSTTERDEYLKIPFSMRAKIASGDASVLTNFTKEIYEAALKEEFILTITENGYGKRTSSYEYRVTQRNTFGVMNIDTGTRNGKVVSSFAVNNNDDVILMTNMGTIIRTEVKDIRITSRIAKGVKIINLKKGEKVVSVSKFSIEKYV